MSRERAFYTIQSKVLLNSDLMPNIVKEEVDTLIARINVQLSQEDYLPKLNAELNKYRKKAQIKGFRKGKTPMSFIRKMYGNSILGEVVNDLLQKSVTDYMAEEKLNILGQPIPSEEQEPFEFDVKSLQDYEFKFDLGLAPEFEVEGLDKSNKFERLAVKVPEEMVSEEMVNAAKRNSIQSSVDDGIQEEDILKLDAEELDGDAVKENGWASTFTIMVNRIADEALVKEILGKKKGDKIRINIFELEKDATEEHVRKYFLQVQENDEDVVIGQHFDATIADVTRAQPAEMNQEFFDKFFGEGEVSSEAEARDRIEADLQKYFDEQAGNIVSRDIRNRLMETNDLELPHAFLKRWLSVTNEGMPIEEIEKEYDAFSENLRWSLIRTKLVKQFEVEVKEEEMLEGFKNSVRRYFGGYGNELIVLNTANRLMEDKEQADKMYQEIMTDKLFKALRENIEMEDKVVTKDEFEEIVAKIRTEMQPEAPAEPEDAILDMDEATTEEEITEDVEQ